MTDYRKLADTILHLRSWGGLKDVDAMTMDEWKAVDTALRLCADRSAPASSSLARGEIALPEALFQKVYEQHALAAEALTDSHGDIHREIVAELEACRSFAPAASERGQFQEAIELLQEGATGFGRVLVATSDQEAVYGWTKRCRAFLAKVITGAG